MTRDELNVKYCIHDGWSNYTKTFENKEKAEKFIKELIAKGKDNLSGRPTLKPLENSKGGYSVSYFAKNRIIKG